MLLATAITVVLTTAFTGQTDTKIAKLEADQQKALAAAEAGVEAALKSGTNVNISDLQLGSTGTANVSSFGEDQSFVSPSVINANGAYTYYVSDYVAATGEFLNPWNNSLKIYYGTQSGTDCNSDVALDISLMYGNPTTLVKKFVAVNASTPTSANDIANSIPAGQAIGSPATTFYCRTSDINLGSGSYPNSKLLIVRVLLQNTKLGFESTTAGTPLKAQGKLVTSEAKTAAGASKKVQLFQSYPQIPAEFFVTSF